MKYRLPCALLALLLTVGCFAACGEKKNDAVTEPNETVTEAPTEKPSKPEDTTDYEALLSHPFAALTDAPAADFSYTVENGKATITKYVGSQTQIRVPATIEGCPVTAISDEAFAGHGELTVLYIPDSVSSFGAGILKGCGKLYALRTPLSGAEGTTHLGYLYGAESYETNNVSELRALDFLELGGTPAALPSYALYDCNDLVALKLPDSVKTLEPYALYRCEALKYLNTEHLTVIESHAMDFCLSLETLTFSDSLQRIGLGAFESCHGLRRLTIPFVGESRESNRFLGYIFGAEQPAFSKGFYSLSLEWVTVTEGITALDPYAFFECATLRSVTLPQSITSIGARAFSGCVKLCEAALPNQLTALGDHAFSGCEKLAQITLGEGLTDLGVNAFLNCTALTAVTLPATLKSLPNACFQGCSALETIDLGGVTTVGKNAFWGCNSLHTVTSSAEVSFENGNENASTVLEN